MKVYISGKISGLNEKEVIEKFANAEKLIRCKFGYDVINPLKLDHSGNKTWDNHMKTDLIAMLQCDAIYMLPDWQISKGAIIEHDLAKNLDFHFFNFK